MAKIDLGLVNSNGRGRPVPKEMDRHIVKFIVGRRKSAVEADPSLLQTERWDHSDVFYASRTWLNQHGWDTSVYNDNTVGGATRRKDLYDMIKSVCEDFYHVKRHQIGIYPDERAVMAYNGMMYAASFDNLRNLMSLGTDVICVEKQGTVIKMMPFTDNAGVAFIQSQGFISEYGIALARLANRDRDASYKYTDRYLPRSRANLGNLTDCDSSGLVIGMKVKGATRIGIDPDTIDEINQVNKGLEDELDIDLPLELEDVEESNEINDHWKGLRGILDGTGKFYKSLTWMEISDYRDYLTARPEILGGDTMLIDYLKDKRIELNTILALVKPQAFWNWLRWRMLQLWPSRNYLRGGLYLDDNLRTPTLNRFIDFYEKQTEPVIRNSVTEARNEVSFVRGLYDDVDGFSDNVQIIRKAIEGDIMHNVLLQDEKIQKLDLALEKIMKDGNGNGIGKDKTKETELDDADDDDESGDGNEWND